jgi:membrane protease YdiL (CAAX protease family)
LSTEVPQERRRLAREMALASLGVLALLGGVKHLAAALPGARDLLFAVAAVAQLYGPIWLMDRRRRPLSEIGLDRSGLAEDLRWAGIWAAATLVPYALAHAWWMTQILGRSWAPHWPSGLPMELVVQVGVVALPEEVFFRGYLQRGLERLWPARRRLWGAPFGIAIVAASAVFGLAHVVGEYRLDRLGPFVPGLAFGWLRARTGRVAGAVAYHAFCNLLAEVLGQLYR